LNTFFYNRFILHGHRKIEKNNDPPLPTSISTINTFLSASINNNTEAKVLHYHRIPQVFVQKFRRCMVDKKCKIYYHHVGKTGGTYVESVFFDTFPLNRKYIKKKGTCCFSAMVKRFEENKKGYCSAKFSSYQVRGSQFQHIVQSCMDFNEKRRHAEGKDAKFQKKALVLSTYREPISRTLSNINQNCNKNFNRRTQELKDACIACKYESHTDTWDKFVQETNKIYQGLKLVAEMQIKNVDVLMVDIKDINFFLDNLFESIEEKKANNGSFHFKKPRSSTRNTEGKLKRCNFGMTSTMVKSLDDGAQEIYKGF